jgi:hypothetical protein
VGDVIDNLDHSLGIRDSIGVAIAGQVGAYRADDIAVLALKTKRDKQRQLLLIV